MTIDMANLPSLAEVVDEVDRQIECGEILNDEADQVYQIYREMFWFSDAAQELSRPEFNNFANRQEVEEYLVNEVRYRLVELYNTYCTGKRPPEQLIH